ncbi:MULTISPECIES: beta-ketoacyl synthase N-terminal-like domain-containing protein [Flavobacterium]|uniref:Beta-ketoacyl synthase N-terminal-like domain-containing protein n=1 Tax=Flavobacterium jumunjinense TaxID=998845 RepID=A0ABV5GLL5_9FLAO|nr:MULTISPECIES: beta-ketoacyl synthase N-terminal-like domain-containing protein [Flavobacterium]
MNQKISITALASLSTLGTTKKEIWDNYLTPKSHIAKKQIGDKSVWAASISEKLNEEIQKLQESDIKYKGLDKSVVYAIYVSRLAMQQANWSTEDIFGINIGSSRGATELFEKYHAEFVQTNRVSTLASPTTTLGNISSWVANDLQSSGPEISHSITCSTSLHSLLNGVAWLLSGMTNKFLVGGSEAPLTPFTIAQMQALSIYSRQEDDYPCKAFDLSKKENTMVIGEGASVIALEIGEKDNALAFVEGVGYATEVLQHNISISTDAECFQKSMKMALKNTPIEEVDAIVMHAPGTIKGDTSELNAIRKVFGNQLPFLTTNKWKIGHTFGASGLLSVELAVLMLQNQELIAIPFYEQEKRNRPIKKILVNAVGFGGNAVSILISK